MKRIRGLETEPPKLADYRREMTARGEQPDYDAFREFRYPEGSSQGSRNEDSPYFELKEKLHEAQQGLCAYCELQLSVRGPFQVEHYRPRSGGLDRHLDYKNLLGCCEGGENPNHAHLGPRYEDHFSPPPKKNRCCGASKGDYEPDCSFLDPRTIPLLPSGGLPGIVRIDKEGKITPCDAGCAAVGLPPAQVAATLKKLNLQDSPRMVLNRKNLWAALKKKEQPPFTAAFIADELSPRFEASDSSTATLQKLWSTRRCFLNSLPEQPDAAEAWLATDEAKAALC